MKQPFKLREWHERHGHTYKSGSSALGMGTSAYYAHLKSETHPKWLILACKAIDRGIKA